MDARLWSVQTARTGTASVIPFDTIGHVLIKNCIENKMWFVERLAVIISFVRKISLNFYVFIRFSNE